MSLLEIHVLGSPILRQETKPVDRMTDELRRLTDDMFDTMHAAKGIGLAAPQVGRPERLAVIDIENNPIVVVNPEIILSDGSAKGEEAAACAWSQRRPHRAGAPSLRKHFSETNS